MIDAMRPARAQLDDASRVLYGFPYADVARALRSLPDPNAPDAPGAIQADVRPHRRDLRTRHWLTFWRRAWRDGDQRWWTWEAEGVASTPAEAWEILCTALDLPSWVDDPRRRFADPVVGAVTLTEGPGDDRFGRHRRFVARVRHASGARSQVEQFLSDDALLGEPFDPARVAREQLRATLDERASRCVLPHPPTVAACLAFAADAPNVAAVEAIAREHVAQTPGWCDAHDPPAVWLFLGPAEVSAARALAGAAAETIPARRALFAAGYLLESVSDAGIVLVAPTLEGA